VRWVDGWMGGRVGVGRGGGFCLGVGGDFGGDWVGQRLWLWISHLTQTSFRKRLWVATHATLLRQGGLGEGRPSPSRGVWGATRPQAGHWGRHPYLQKAGQRLRLLSSHLAQTSPSVSDHGWLPMQHSFAKGVWGKGGLPPVGGVGGRRAPKQGIGDSTPTSKKQDS